MSVVSPEEQKARVVKYVQWGAMALIAVVLAPLAYAMAISVIEATVAIAVAAGVVGVVWMATPAVADYLGNMRIAAIKAIAAANPIETMQSIYADKMDEYNKQEAAIDEVDKQYMNVAGRVDAITKKYGVERAETFIKVRDKIKQALDQMNAESKMASKALVIYKSKIDEANDFWETQKAINKALDVSEKARGDVFRQIREQVSFETTNDQLNLAFARLDGAVRRRENWNDAEEQGTIHGDEKVPAQLTAGPVVTDFTSTPIKQGTTIN